MSMTKQEILDFVVTKLREQGGPSVHPLDPSSCMYRGPNGRKCAVGWLIPDELYKPSIEHNTVRAAFRELEMSLGNVSFLTHLQQVHDGLAYQLKTKDKDTWDIDDFNAAFVNFAEFHNLEFKP